MALPRPEGLPRPEMPPPEAAANRKAIPRSPLSPPLTRGLLCGRAFSYIFPKTKTAQQRQTGAAGWYCPQFFYKNGEKTV